jgi:hypothetical protein
MAAQYPPLFSDGRVAPSPLFLGQNILSATKTDHQTSPTTVTHLFLSIKTRLAQKWTTVEREKGYMMEIDSDLPPRVMVVLIAGIGVTRSGRHCWSTPKCTNNHGSAWVHPPLLFEFNSNNFSIVPTTLIWFLPSKRLILNPNEFLKKIFTYYWISVTKYWLLLRIFNWLCLTVIIE